MEDHGHAEFEQLQNTLIYYLSVFDIELLQINVVQEVSNFDDLMRWVLIMANCIHKDNAIYLLYIAPATRLSTGTKELI